MCPKSKNENNARNSGDHILPHFDWKKWKTRNMTTKVASTLAWLQGSAYTPVIPKFGKESNDNSGLCTFLFAHLNQNHITCTNELSSG